MEHARKWLWRVPLSTFALLNAGWLLYKLRLLPPDLISWTGPLLLIGLGTCLLGEAIPFSTSLLRATRFQWSCRVAVASVAIAVTVTFVGYVEHNLGVTIPWKLALPIDVLLLAGGLAMLYDAWVGAARALLPTLAVRAAVCAGTGLLLLGASEAAGAWAAWSAAAGLLGIGVGGITGSVAWRQVQRADGAALPRPN